MEEYRTSHENIRRFRESDRCRYDLFRLLCQLELCGAAYYEVYILNREIKELKRSLIGQMHAHPGENFVKTFTRLGAQLEAVEEEKKGS